MNNNVYIILLIFLIVYLIYKISTNNCDCFSIGSQTCNGFIKSACNAGKRAYKCEWNALTNKCEQRKISLRPENPSRFLANINKAFNASNSNGVFVSMNISRGLDGSGSVVHKNIQAGVYGSNCFFGFIWDTNWLDTNLVECLFSKDIGSKYFGTADCIEPNFCKLANTSGSNIPDRCSHGLMNYYNFYNTYKKDNNILYPTNCNQNIKYDLDKMDIVDLENSKNCYTYIKDSDKIIGSNIFRFNEGVFLKDVEDSLEYSEGFERLIKEEKPKPAALLLLNNNVDCSDNIVYKNTLKGLKDNFTIDTIVAIALYDDQNRIITSFDPVPTTLGEMPGYNDV